MNKFHTTLISLKIGDRIVVPKSHLDLIQHHAIFLGYENGHYWFIENKEGIGVRIVNASTFFYDVLKVTRIVPFVPKAGYTRNDLVKYALSKVGKRYELTRYNCEHLASELQHKVVRSMQANTGIFIAAALVFLLIIGALVSNSNNNFKTT
ncbi:MAG: lecithin retinol acyltransferase [Bacteroidota bacterium]|jgi:hypothetical protein|nr:lecithin retinol acyltransferase [Bacteroidota bacterium]